MSVSIRMTSDERRAAILDAAVRLFSERGFRGTTTRALADAVGVTEPVLYEHFSSKRELYEAIVETKSREGMAKGAAVLRPLAEARDDRAFFISLGRLIVSSLTEDQAYARLLLSVALENRELGAAFHERQREAREGVAGYIAERIREGAFRPIDPALAARAFIGMLAHHGMTRMLYDDDFVSFGITETIEEMVDLFLKGIAS